MRNLWLIAKHEYLKVAGKKSFVLGTLGMPVLMVVVTAISILMTAGGRGRLPFGYVDHAGLLIDPVVPPSAMGESAATFRAFPDVAAGEAALQDGDIQALYIVPHDYMATGEIELRYLTREPSLITRDDFRALLRANLLANYDPLIRERVIAGSSITIRAADGSREFAEDNFLDFMIPFVAAFLFVFAVMNAGGYMLQAVTDEKENRTVEVLATSVRPEELIGGKAIGLIGVGLTQLAIWGATAVAGLIVASFFIPMPASFSIPWSLLAVVSLFFLPAYALIAGMMTAIGGIVTDFQQGQQISGILNLLFMLPFFFVMVILSRPDNPVVIALTLFPPSAFVTITMRWATTVVPLWQLVTSWLLLVASAIFSVWAASRIFRAGMLRYGQTVNVKAVFAALRKPVQ